MPVANDLFNHDYVMKPLFKKKKKKQASKQKIPKAWLSESFRVEGHVEIWGRVG